MPNKSPISLDECGEARRRKRVSQSTQRQSLYEINLKAHSGRLARQLEEIFEMDKTDAEEITREAWEKRPYFARVLERSLVALRPLL